MWLTVTLIYHGIYDNSNIHISLLNLFNSLRLVLTNQLKLEAADGKLRFTDVMSTAEILRLIQLCPSPKAEKIKLWIAELAVKGRKVVKCLENAIKKAKDLIRCRAANIIMTIEFHEFDIHGDDDPHCLL